MRTSFKFSLILGLAMALAACDRSDKNAAASEPQGTTLSVSAKSDAGEDVNIKADGETGQLAVKLPGVDATLAMPKIVLKDSSFDLVGVKLYPGATVSTMSVVANGPGDAHAAKVKLVYLAPAPPPVVRDWFQNALMEKSVRVKPAGDSLMGVTRDGANFRMDFAETAKGQTSGTIFITDKR